MSRGCRGGGEGGSGLTPHHREYTGKAGPRMTPEFWVLRHVFAWAECAELRLWRIVLGCSPLAAHHHDHRRPGVNRFYQPEPAQVVHPRSCLLPTHTHTNPQCNVHVCTHIPTVHCLRLPSHPAVQWRLFTLEQSPVTSHHLPPATSPW